MCGRRLLLFAFFLRLVFVVAVFACRVGDSVYLLRKGNANQDGDFRFCTACGVLRRFCVLRCANARIYTRDGVRGGIFRTRQGGRKDGRTNIFLLGFIRYYRG